MQRAGVWQSAAVVAALAFVSVGVGASVGCVAAEPSAPPRGVVVSGPPPAPLAEPNRPPPPSPTSAWVAGYWHWTGMQYAWIPGHWESAPPGATWSAPRYSMTEGTYTYEAGAWRPAAPAQALPPVQASTPPARANALR